MTPVPPAAAPRPDPDHVAAHDTAWLLVQIRWVPIASQFAATVYAAQVLGIDLPRGQMATVSALLVAFNLLTAAVWHYMLPGMPRWLVGGALVVGPYLMLGRGLMAGKHISKRTYRYAE